MGMGQATVRRHPGLTLSFLPVIVLTIIFGLSNDYEIFVVSRIKEQYDRSHDIHRIDSERPRRQLPGRDGGSAQSSRS